MPPDGSNFDAVDLVGPKFPCASRGDEADLSTRLRKSTVYLESDALGTATRLEREVVTEGKDPQA
jgi:hypothetical protein